jgi:hypothetical protein
MKKERTLFNNYLLNKIIERDNCIIILSNYENLNRSTRINFTCNCGENNNKIFRQMYETNAICSKCTIIQKHIKRKLFYENNPEKEKERIDKIINTKIELNIKNPDRKINILNKQKETFLKNNIKNPNRINEILKKRFKTISILNISNPDRKTEIRNKVKQKNIDKFGVEVPMYSPIIREKVKNIILKKYGVENVFQSEEINKKLKKII